MKFKQKQKNLIALLFVIFAFNIYLFSQNNPFSSIVPVSPDVASLGKFGDIPVGNYTGVPDITIPIFNIKQGSLNLPISLSYHAAGIKVTERASWAGLGWALNAGGMISRSIRGIPDEIGTEGYLNNGIAIPSGISFNDRYNAAKGNLDLEPDLYYYNFLGYSGSFEMDRTGKTFLTPYKDILIEGFHVQNGYKNNTVGPWRVTLENGVVLILESLETQLSKAITPVLFSIHGGTTAWFVDEIISADKKDAIYFDYNDINYNFPLVISSSVYEDLGSAGSCSGCSGAGIVNSGGDETEVEQYHTKQLSKIRFRGGSISFLAANATACNTLIPQSILQEIDVADPNGTIVKKFSLQYSTYDPVDRTYLPSNQGNCDHMDDLDIFLTKIQENSNPPYVIDYSLDKGMPQKTSPQQDHWGYYNGSGITTLIPNPVRITSTRYTIGSGREANFDYAKQGTISQIIYPTGGSTKFSFESNDVDADDAQNHTFLNQTFRTQTGTVSASSYQVDYGWNGHILSTLIASQPYLPTTITFTMSNYQQTSNSNITLVNTTDPNAQPIQVGFDFQGNNFWSGTVNVPNGTYNVVANKKIAGPDITSGQTYQLNINSYVNTYFLSDVPVDINGFKTATVGGLRIKKTESFDPITNNTLTKEYTYKNGFKGKSSGKLVWAINYDHVGKMYTCANIENDGHFYYAQEKYDILNASSNYPLGLTQGSPVGYSEVMVKETSNGKDNGYEDNFYSTPADYPDQRTNPVFQQSGLFYSLGTVAPNCCTPIGGVSTDVNSSIFQYPFAPPISYDFARGQLVKKDIYKSTSIQTSPYQLIQSTHNNYKIIDFSESLTGEKVGLTFDSYVGDAFSGYYPYIVPTGVCTAPYIEEQFSDYDFRKYNFILTSTDVKDYDANNNFTAATITYDYNTDLYVPNKITTTTSKGDEKVEQSVFAIDYKNLTATDNLTQGIKNLIDNHIDDAVIEQYTQIKKRDETSYKTLQSVFTSYKPTVPWKNEILLTEFPTGASIDFAPASVISGQITISPYYRSRYKFLTYDADGNFLDNQKASDEVDSYLWDYNANYSVAHILNSTQTNVAYTSFEADGTGNWTISSGSVNSSSAKTGSKSYNLGGTNSISWTSTTTGNYILSYWVKPGTGSFAANGSVGTAISTHNGWTLYTQTLSNINSVTISGTATIDELRLYPVNAQMTTYTYLPLVGMTSQCDAANHITYYEYDGLQRMSLIRDQDYNIIKKICYDYAGQPLSCSGLVTLTGANNTNHGDITVSFTNTSNNAIKSFTMPVNSLDNPTPIGALSPGTYTANVTNPSGVLFKFTLCSYTGNSPSAGQTLTFNNVVINETTCHDIVCSLVTMPH